MYLEHGDVLIFPYVKDGRTTMDQDSQEQKTKAHVNVNEFDARDAGPCSAAMSRAARRSSVSLSSHEITFSTRDIPNTPSLRGAQGQAGAAARRTQRPAGCRARAHGAVTEHDGSFYQDAVLRVTQVNDATMP